MPNDCADATDEMRIMQEGYWAALPIQRIESIEADGYVNDRPRPLALYYLTTIQSGSTES